MTVDEAGIRKAILLLNAHNVTLAGHVWDLLDAYRVAITRLEAATAPKKPTLREQLRDPDSGVINIGRPRLAVGDKLEATPAGRIRVAGSIETANPDRGQIAGQMKGDATVYVLLQGNDKIYHRLPGAKLSCGYQIGGYIGAARPVPYARALAASAAPCPKCWGVDPAPEPRSFAENANLPGSDDTGLVLLDESVPGNAIYHRRDVSKVSCHLAAPTSDVCDGDTARSAGATPCPECYRNWPGTDGSADCYHCTSQAPCIVHNCPACRGSGDNTDGSAACTTCRGTGDRQDGAYGGHDCATPSEGS